MCPKIAEAEGGWEYWSDEEFADDDIPVQTRKSTEQIHQEIRDRDNKELTSKRNDISSLLIFTEPHMEGEYRFHCPMRSNSPVTDSC